MPSTQKNKFVFNYIHKCHQNCSTPSLQHVTTAIRPTANMHCKYVLVYCGHVKIIRLMNNTTNDFNYSFVWHTNAHIESILGSVSLSVYLFVSFSVTLLVGDGACDSVSSWFSSESQCSELCGEIQNQLTNDYINKTNEKFVMICV